MIGKYIATQLVCEIGSFVFPHGAYEMQDSWKDIIKVLTVISYNFGLYYAR